MKKDFLELVERVPKIELKLRRLGLLDRTDNQGKVSICNVAEFIEWKTELQYELQDIYDRTKDSYVWHLTISSSVLNKFGQKGYNEWNLFNELKGSLKALCKNIDKYYPQTEGEFEVKEMTSTKPAMIFISHSSKDIRYVKPFVDLLADIGLTNNLFCSSVPDYGIPLNENIYDYLSSMFQKNDLYVLFMLSDNYYSSSACLNEMGAAWVLKSDYTSILLPGYEYQKINGAVDPYKIGLKLDDNEESLKKKLGELKNIMVNKFGITVPDIRWETKRNEFITAINKE